MGSWIDAVTESKFADRIVAVLMIMLLVLPFLVAAFLLVYAAQ